MLRRFDDGLDVIFHASMDDALAGEVKACLSCNKIEEMDFDRAIAILNELLAIENPETFNSSWILKHAPKVYSFFWRSVRTEADLVDWDKVTYALEWKFQRRWVPGRKRRSKVPYENPAEVATILTKYEDKLYTFLAPQDAIDRRIRDVISIMLVRMAQYGNLSAKRELMRLLNYAIEDWLERFPFLSRWKGYETEIQEKLEGCIRRYRYTGSFVTYVFRTLEYAGRGIRPFYAYSLDEPVATDAEKRRVEDVIQDSESGEAQFYSPDRFKTEP